MVGRSVKILILYASYGEGHVQAAKALKESLRGQGPCDTVLLDLMAESHPLLNELTKFVYMQSFKTIPHLYGWVYKATRDMQAQSPFGHLLHSFGMRKLAEMLAREEPDLVIHTFPHLALPALRRKTGRNLPIVNVITDFDLHGRWLHPDIDQYYVATEDMKLEAIRRGIPGERIMVSGIPVHPSFHEHFIQPCTLPDGRVLDPNRKTILIMSGATGVMPDIYEIGKELSRMSHVQVLIVCGRNKQLKAELDASFGHEPHIYTYGFVTFVPLLMRVSDWVVTKSGGITLSESIACGLPMLIFRPVPGQELNNALYLEHKGAALIVHDSKELAHICIQMVADPELENRMKRSVQQLQRTNSADRIADDILIRLTDKTSAVRTP